jgi:hypothetical protein
MPTITSAIRQPKALAESANSVRQPFGRMDSSMFCRADRGYCGFERWRQARYTGAHPLWRCVESRILPVLQERDDCSFVSEIRPTGVTREQAQAQAIKVRVIGVRWLRHECATQYRIPHAKQPFTKHLHLLRRSQPQSGAFPPNIVPAVDAVGSLNCWHWRPPCTQRGRSTGAAPAWSSGATRRT